MEILPVLAVGVSYKTLSLTNFSFTEASYADAGIIIRGAKIMTAAVTRMLARAAAAEGVRLLPRNKSDKSMGVLAALLTEAAMVGLDKPDTRSWTFLPARAYLCRARVPPGPHEIRVTLSGKTPETRTIRVDVPAGGFRVVAITEPR